ncbi:hypothetical protein [Bacillus sp. CECT 9360]|uniref:hypothetical protein n=1 Tax=Bacillus sp. CECT 9360 TaxID=2845821 RepID=UPI001E64A5F0|nr:hypothetical protein [Bacillus sp. CECT 9360]CAH0346697.1 hypothetical protein BCI9360_03042 [Bacillus sp. CECT 9360]
MNTLDNIQDFKQHMKTAKPLFQINKSLMEIPCSIQKDINTNHQLEFPLIHKDILGQILYEALQLQGIPTIEPILIILHPLVVEGIKLPGFYRFEQNNSRYICQKRIRREDNVHYHVRKLQQENKIFSNIGIGYLMNIEEVTKYNSLQNTLLDTLQLMNNVDLYLNIHGEVTSRVINHLDKDATIFLADDFNKKHSIVFTQWLKQIK